VSGDGVEQDDYVTFLGAQGFLPPKSLWADNVFVDGVRLPFFEVSEESGAVSPHLAVLAFLIYIGTGTAAAQDLHLTLNHDRPLFTRTPASPSPAPRTRPRARRWR